MTNPTTKSDLTVPKQRLLSLLQELNFGRIENLKISAGEPVFDPAPTAIKTLKMSAENGAREERDLEDFSLKKSIIELFSLIAEVQNGSILSINVKHGLPISVELECGGQT